MRYLKNTTYDAKEEVISKIVTNLNTRDIQRAGLIVLFFGIAAKLHLVIFARSVPGSI